MSKEIDNKEFANRVRKERHEEFNRSRPRGLTKQGISHHFQNGWIKAPTDIESLMGYLMYDPHGDIDPCNIYTSMFDFEPLRQECSFSVFNGCLVWRDLSDYLRGSDLKDVEVVVDPNDAMGRYKTIGTIVLDHFSEIGQKRIDWGIDQHNTSFEVVEMKSRNKIEAFTWEEAISNMLGIIKEGVELSGTDIKLIKGLEERLNKYEK